MCIHVNVQKLNGVVAGSFSEAEQDPSLPTPPLSSLAATHPVETDGASASPICDSLVQQPSQQLQSESSSTVTGETTNPVDGGQKSMEELRYCT